MVSATTSSSSSLSLLSSSSLSISSPRSHAYNFCSFFFLLNSFVFFYHSATVRFAAATSGSFGSGAELSVKMSLFGWSRYPNVSIKGSEIQLKRRHGERELTKSMYPGSGRIGGCPDTGYTISRTMPAPSFKGRPLERCFRCHQIRGSV